jgi:hypothetical protein
MVSGFDGIRNHCTVGAIVTVYMYYFPINGGMEDHFPWVKGDNV